jgi:hypothetical protein
VDDLAEGFVTLADRREVLFERGEYFVKVFHGQPPKERMMVPK